ncbi:co-chaperone protein p23-1-like isoform X2 [Zingiber officinale]|uniref:co-chaperone protein p23-1-like isoform X2 n=1 Tax=Zingiber officinale TaxID=94328 RepID=UPI001C4B1415|nr:co-chaperone protein p23-1-like isoform X2 [Zingiber officinale]
MSRHPTVKWAQRSDKVYLTVDLADAKDVKVNLEPEGEFSFFATKEDVPYEVDLKLFDRINVKESKLNISARSIVCVVKKLDKKWWSRLLKEDAKPPAFLKVDWDRWIDEDDENEEAGDKDRDDQTDDNISSRKNRKRRKKSKKKKGLLQLIAQKLRFACISKE